MKAYLSIGEIAKASGASPKALRLYEKKGMLRVKREANGYRLYPSHQLEAVRSIKRFQDLGFTLKEIQLLMEKRDILADLRVKTQALRRSIQDLVSQEASLGSLIKTMESKGKALLPKQRRYVMQMFQENQLEKIKSSSVRSEAKAEASLLEHLKDRHQWGTKDHADKMKAELDDDENMVSFYQRRELRSSREEIRWIEAAQRHYNENPEIEAKSGREYLQIKVVGNMGFVVSHGYIEWTGPNYLEEAVDMMRITEIFERKKDGWKLVHAHRSMEYPEKETLNKTLPFREGFQDMARFSESLKASRKKKE
jgi:MerR family transcriptional regulator, copper efflux regulator